MKGSLHSADRSINKRIGSYRIYAFSGEEVKAYLPPPLPPEPPIDLAALQLLLEQAIQALGRLDGLSSLIPKNLFIYHYIRKEAVLSAQIEGTQSSLSDLLLFENQNRPGVPLDDVQEVVNYVRALNFGLARLKELPLSSRLLREIHAVLLEQGRGSEKEPGEFRRSQNWIGGARPGLAVYVPPPWEEVEALMGNLEQFLHREDPTLPVIVKAALAHGQFESIHPFLDGNGRLGRLLITFYLCSCGVLKEPLLYLSLYFKTNRDRYYELLNRLRSHGEWEQWVTFFLEGVRETADRAVALARSALDLFANHQAQLHREAHSVNRVFEFAKENAIFSINRAMKDLSLTHPTVTKACRILEREGILEEITGQSRNRNFAYSRFVQLLSEGTEPLPR